MAEKSTVCSVEQCKRNGPFTKGLCRLHYLRKLRKGDPGPAGYVYQRNGSKCGVTGCARKPTTKGLCNLHYERKRTTGSVGPVEPINAPPGTGHIDNGYRRIGVNGKLVREHRLVMEQVLGRPLLPNEEVHHKNTLRDDNSPGNLELWVKSQPAGGRVSDLVAWAKELLALYEPSALA